MTLVYQNGFARPPDVPAFVPQPIVYASGANPVIIGDGSGTRGSPMPILSSMPADIPSTATGWQILDTGNLPVEGAGVEPKFRFHMNASHVLPDDPIRNYGQPGASHLHQFFNNTTTNAFSTFASLRNRANENAAASRAASTGAGGPYNGTGYWVPAMLDVNGDVVEPGMFFGYYTNESVATALLTQRLPRGLRYVFGFPMDDPTGAVEQAELDAANAQPGTAGRYDKTHNGFRGWELLTPDTNTLIQTSLGQDTSPCLRNLDGSDPWGGAAYAGCWFKAVLQAPQFYDGVNLWSPGGYQHLRQGWLDHNTGQVVGPQGWYRMPELQVYPFYRATSSTSHLSWALSSDAHIASVLGHAIAGCSTMHTDWLGAWDDSVFGADTGWQIQCTAAKNGATPRECASGCFDSSGHRLLGSIVGDNAPDGSRVPQVNFFENRPHKVLPSAWTGPTTLRARAA